jgi:hypothetical protein
LKTILLPPVAIPFALPIPFLHEWNNQKRIFHELNVGEKRGNVHFGGMVLASTKLFYDRFFIPLPHPAFGHLLPPDGGRRICDAVFYS